MRTKAKAAMRTEDRETWAVGRGALAAILGPGLHEGRVPQRRTEDNYASLGFGLVASPASSPSSAIPGGGACFGIDDRVLPRLGAMPHRSATVRTVALRTSLAWDCIDDVDLVQESDKAVVGMERVRPGPPARCP